MFFLHFNFLAAGNTRNVVGRGSAAGKFHTIKMEGLLPAWVEVDMDFSGCFLYAQPLIPRGRCEFLGSLALKMSF